MNKKLIVLAVISSLAAPMVALAEGPSLYGRLHLSYGSVEEVVGATTTVDNWQLQSHASRLGVKGARDFGDGLEGTYKLEWEVNPTSDNSGGAGDTGSAGFVRRNQYVGLKGGWGEVRIGIHDTPLKMAQGKFDQFGDTSGDLKYAGDEDGENRLNNILLYLGKTGDIKYSFAMVPGEDTGTGTVDNGPADTISASLSYSAGSLYVAFAHDSYANAANAAEDDLNRLIATYKIEGSQIGLLVQSGVEAADSTAAKEDWLGISFNTKIGDKHKLKAQYIIVEDSATPSAKEGTLLAIGVDHKLDKKTTGYFLYTNLEEEQAGATTLEETFLGLGIVLKF